MHLAMHNWMRPEPLETIAVRLKRHGVTALALEGRGELYDSREAAQVLKQAGISCWGGVASMEDGRSLIAADAATRARSVKYAKSVITMIHELNGEIVTIIPGEIGNPRPQGEPAEEWARAVAAMQEIYDHAMRVGVRIAIEPVNRFETHFINRVDQALALADEIGPDCGVCPDTFHMNIEEQDSLAAIRAAAGRIVDFHVSDSNQLACGMGHLDWPALIQTLRTTGYDGAIAIEFVPTADRTPVNRFPGSVEDFETNRVSEQFYDSLIERCLNVLKPLIG